LDELISKLRADYPQCQISNPLVIDEESEKPSLIATWLDYGPVVLPQVDYVVVTKPGSKERWPSILGHISLEELKKTLGDAIRQIELDGNFFFVLTELDSNQIDAVKAALHSGLPAAKS
jgi:hypothetical protein